MCAPDSATNTSSSQTKKNNNNNTTSMAKQESSLSSCTSLTCSSSSSSSSSSSVNSVQGPTPPGATARTKTSIEQHRVLQSNGGGSHSRLSHETGNHHLKETQAQPLGLVQQFYWMTGGIVLSVFFAIFAAYFPYFLAPQAAQATYHYAYYQYDVATTHFDNTFGTYGTDYILAVAMFLAIWLFPSTTTTRSHVHTFRSQGMLLCYLFSVLAGGLAHQFYTTVESRGYLSFRFLWTICVGTVTAAPAFMGSVATELHRLDCAYHLDAEQKSTTTARRRQRQSMIIPTIPTVFWYSYALCSTVIVALGGMSFQRPACDIFMAGITQSPSTFYVMAWFTLGFPQSDALSTTTRMIGAVSFILNAPLLPLYPLLVQYTDWSLGTVNLFLHCWLFVAWSLQGWSLRQVAKVLDQNQQEPEAVESSKEAMAVKKQC